MLTWNYFPLPTHTHINYDEIRDAKLKILAAVTWATWADQRWTRGWKSHPNQHTSTSKFFSLYPTQLRLNLVALLQQNLLKLGHVRLLLIVVVTSGWRFQKLISVYLQVNFQAGFRIPVEKLFARVLFLQELASVLSLCQGYLEPIHCSV